MFAFFVVCDIIVFLWVWDLFCWCPVSCLLFWCSHVLFDFGSRLAKREWEREREREREAGRGRGGERSSVYACRSCLPGIAL